MKSLTKLLAISSLALYSTEANSHINPGYEFNDLRQARIYCDKNNSCIADINQDGAVDFYTENITEVKYYAEELEKEIKYIKYLKFTEKSLTLSESLRGELNKWFKMYSSKHINLNQPSKF